MDALFFREGARIKFLPTVQNGFDVRLNLDSLDEVVGPALAVEPLRAIAAATAGLESSGFQANVSLKASDFKLPGWVGKIAVELIVEGVRQ